MLIAVAFWALAIIALTSLQTLHLWGMPQVVGVIARATMACVVILVGLVGIRCLFAWRKSGSSVPVLSALGGMPGVLLFGAVASYLAIGVVVMDEASWQPGTAEGLKYAVLSFGVLVAAAIGGRAVLERAGVGRLLQGVLVVLIASCAVILASPVLRDLGILAPYRIPFRLTGAFGNPNDPGLVACMTAALAAAFLTNGGPRALGWLGLVAGVAAGLGTASRTALVVLGAMAVLFLLLNVRGRPRGFVLAVAGTVLAGTAAFAGVVFFSGGPSEWSRLRVFSPVAPEGALFCDPSPTDSPGADCAVLLAARDILAGDMALNWSRTVSVNRWRGVTVDGPEGRVTRLDLAGLGLNGRIPSGLGHLDRLVSLSLQRNRLTGRIPPELGKLADLEVLGLACNALTGAVPAELAKLSNLRDLWLSGNRLTGSLPPELHALADKEASCLAAPADSPGLRADYALLLANRNILAGDAQLNWSEDVPIEFWQGVTIGGPPQRVTALELPRAGLSGRLFSELGELGGLVALDLSHNRLSGPIPSGLGRLGHLVSLRLEGNRLTGPIPPELGKLSRLTDLWLHGNRLIGLVPPPVAALPELAALRLDDDEAAGELPAQGRDRGRVFDRNLHCQPALAATSRLHDDCATLLVARDVLAGDVELNWSDARPVASWQGITVGWHGRVSALDLRDMNLSGRIPPELGELSHLRFLRLDGNRLTGPIPPELGRLTRLDMLSLDGNRLTGPIPPEIAGLAALRNLWLADNRLTGSIPPELAGIKHLSLAVAGNDLDGCMPWEPHDLHGLRSHDIDDSFVCAVRVWDRLLLWRLGFQKAMEAPVFGHGLGAMKHLDGAPITHSGVLPDPHNLYITLLGEAGIVPLQLFLSSIVLLLRAQWGAPQSPARDATVAWVLAIALYSMTFSDLLNVKVFMFLAGLSVATGAAAWRTRLL